MNKTCTTHTPIMTGAPIGFKGYWRSERWVSCDRPAVTSLLHRWVDDYNLRVYGEISTIGFTEYFCSYHTCKALNEEAAKGK